MIRPSVKAPPDPLNNANVILRIERLAGAFFGLAIQVRPRSDEFHYARRPDRETRPRRRDVGASRNPPLTGSPS